MSRIRSAHTGTANVNGSSATKSVVTSLIVVMALTAATAACGDDETVEVGGQERQLIEIEPADDSTELVEYTSSAMGGVRFSVDPAHHLYTRGDSILVSVEDPTGEGGWEAASISLLTQTADGIALNSVDQVLELLAAVPTAEVTSTGNAIEFRGHYLAGYDVRADASAADHFIVAADRFGSPAFALTSYTPNARIYLGETPAGVLVAASAEADDVANLQFIDVALGTLLATIEPTGGGLDQPLPPAQSLEPDIVQESTARGDLDSQGPTALDAPFSTVEPGTYQLANFGPTFTLNFEDVWSVQPNFPGFIVLTGMNSYGPGDRGLVFLTGMVDVMPIAPGPVAAGEPIPVFSADQVIDVLSTDFEITGIKAVDLDGLAATRFDVRISTDAVCTEVEPCEYAFRTSWGFVKALSPTQSHRIWWIEKGAEGPSMIIAMAPHAHDFIDQATELLGTMEFTS